MKDELQIIIIKKKKEQVWIRKCNRKKNIYYLHWTLKLDFSIQHTCYLNLVMKFTKKKTNGIINRAIPVFRFT